MKHTEEPVQEEMAVQEQEEEEEGSQSSQSQSPSEEFKQKPAHPKKRDQKSISK